MKKTSLLVALPAIALGGLLLSGCGMFRSHSAWQKARQEAPLEIPPSMDRPSTSDALVIPPPGANQPTADGATLAALRDQIGYVSGILVPTGIDWQNQIQADMYHFNHVFCPVEKREQLEKLFASLGHKPTPAKAG